MYPFERFTEEAKKVLTHAQEEAERSHHSYIGTEHLLLGILRGEGPGALALGALNIHINQVRQTIEETLGRNERILIQQIIPTSRVKKVIELSFEEASQQGHQYVDSGHMLIAIMREGDGIAAHVMQDLGTTTEKVVAAVKTARKDARPDDVATYPIADTDLEALLQLLRKPAIADLLRSGGLDVDSAVAQLANPPEEVARLRRFVAGTRAEMANMVDRREYEKAARLQQGEKDLLKRLADAERKWIDGLQPR